MTVNFDPTLSLSENWEAGDALDDAWFMYATENHKKRYRESHADTEIRATVRMFMEMTVHGRIAAGELSALGLQSKPVSDGAPLAIPNSYFKSPMIDIDWNLSTVSWRDHHFSDVTIVAGYLVPGASSLEPVCASTRMKPGPRSIAPLIADAINHLRSTVDHFDELIQEKKINEIRYRVASQNPALYPKESTPARSTIRRYLTSS